MVRTLAFSILFASALNAGALAADLGEPLVPSAPTAADYAFSWTGPYVGVSAGYGFGSSDWENGGVPAINTDFNLDGFFAGGYVGYNYQLSNNVVLGAEADLFFGGMDGSGDCVGGDVPDFRCAADLNFFGTLRARVGYSLDRVLLYGTGGLAIADFDYDRTAAGGPLLEFGGSETEVGFAIGAGIEYAATDNIIVRGEYQYLNFGSSDVSLSNGVGTSSASIDNDMHQVRVGIAYKF